MLSKAAGANDMGDERSVGETTRKRGRLKVFLGYAPGVGKTLAMLEDADRHRQEGYDVVVGRLGGPVESAAAANPREEQLLAHFETVPGQPSAASAALDAVLQRRPQLVLIDQLARKNPPGLRHEARYLEVEELLAAGIDVYTTLNVYQIESQVDAVAYLTGATVQDSVPDVLLDSADQVAMVDMPPQELLERFKGGQVAVQPDASQLMQHFFQPSSLFALRELALRYVARRSNSLMRSYLAGRGLADTEPASPRLLVCITPEASSSRLVRAGRRLADETRADWTVVFVETPDLLELSPEEQVTLSQHFRLAEMLGAQVETLTGRSVADTLYDYVRAHHIQRMMVGRSSRLKWANPFRQSLADRLQRLEPTLSVYVVGDDTTPRRFRVRPFWQGVTTLQIAASLLLVLIPTVLGLLLSPAIISRSANLIMLYLLSIVIASGFLGPVPAMLTTVLSVLVFDFLFIPPLFALFQFAPEYTITFASLVLVSGIISSLVSREQALTRAAQRRAEQVTRLYELSHSLVQAVDMPEILDTIVQHVSRTFDREVVIWLAENKTLVFSASSTGHTLDSSERTAAEWAYQQGRPAGAQTGTFSYTAFRYLPLHTSKEVVGVLGIRFSGPGDVLHPEQERLLSTFVSKAAASIERGLLAEEASQAEILRATEKLQSALLNSISHDLRTPLASITGVLSTLRLEDDFMDAETRRELVETAYGEAERLNRLVGNLLDMSRLESGMLKISLQPCDVQDVVGSALNSLGARLDSHPVEVNIPADLPLVPMDYVLIAQVMINLLENAVKYSPEGQPITVGAHVAGSAVQIEISDRGPGIPPDEIERIFEKFYRVKRFENVIGTGLGLSICKGIVEVHGGRIWAENRPEGGVCFAFVLPLIPTPLGVREPVALSDGDNGYNE